MPSIIEELQKAANSKHTDYVKLARAANAISEEAWNTLSTPAQQWVNDVLVEHENAREQDREPVYPKPDGQGVAADGGSADEPETGEDAGADESPDEAEADEENSEAEGAEQEEEVEAQTHTRRSNGRAAPVAAGRRKKRGPMPQEQKDKIAASRRASNAAKAAAGGGKPTASARKPRSAAAAAAKPTQARTVRKAAPKGGSELEYRIVPGADGQFDIEKVETVSTLVATVYDADMAKEMLSKLQGD